MMAKHPLLLSALVLLSAAACKPSDPPPPIPTPPASGVAAPCKPALVTDVFTPEGMDTRTGCMLVTMSLGAAAGAADLSLAVSLVHSEGNAPPALLYPAAWLGTGGWLSVDEYITADGDNVRTLHTPSGDVVYDFISSVPDATSLDPSDDRKSKLWGELRTRPFDGTFLWSDKDGYYITVGNPADSRSLTKKYQGLLPNDKGSSARLLTRLEKSSIYRGRRNYIDIKRTYDKAGIQVELTSSLFEGTGITPLVIAGPATRADGKAGYQIDATQTLLHGWRSTVSAVVNDKGNVEQLLSQGRNANELHRTSFTYANEATPASTVFQTLVEEEGSAADLRTQRSLEIQERAPVTSATWPFAVKTLVDHSRPGADQTHVIKECPHQPLVHSATPTQPTYFTVNYANGTAGAWEYADDTTRGLLVRSRDALGEESFLQYNLERGGGIPGASQPATAFELKYLTVRGSPGNEQKFMYRFDKFSADTYQLPMIGKVSIPKAVGDKQVISRSVFGDKQDDLAGRVNRTFDVARGVSGADGRTRWEYRGLDGFTYESWDEDGMMLWFRWIDQDKNADGTYDKETIDTYVMGVKQSRTTRDRFGRTLQKVDFDPGQAAGKQPTITFNVTKEGFTDRIDDSGSGETFNIKGWNGPRSTVTSATLERAGQTVVTFNQPTDDLGNPDGAGAVTLGPVKLATSVERLGGGLLKSSSITGPNGQMLRSDMGYAPADSVPNEQKLNGKADTTVTPKAMAAKVPMTAMGGCQ